MENIILQLKDYLNKILGIENLKIAKIELSSIPFILTDLYTFYSVGILNQKLILFAHTQNDNIVPGTINKHIEIIKQKVNIDVVFLCRQMSSYTRRDFIKYKIPFIVPGNQMYIPMLGLDLREHFRQNKTLSAELTPAAQALLLYFIKDSVDIPLTASRISEKLGYACMTVIRAITEITTKGLGKDYKDGKKRYIKFEQKGKYLWDYAFKYLKSPVKKEINLNNVPDGVTYYKAGLNALAKYSMIAAPRNKTLAVSKEDWLKLKNKVEVLENIGEYKLQIWAYSPALYATNGTVDELSLYLSLMDVEDERVEQSLKKMMENYKW